MASYNWEDFRSNQSDRLEVEWGERNLHGTRRSRIPGYFANKPGWLSATIVGTATLAAVGICAVVATTLVRSPFPEQPNQSPSEGNEVEGPGVVTTAPTLGPSEPPTTGPSTAWPTASPSIADSQAPSVMASAVPSMASSAVPTTSAVPTATPSSSPSIGIGKAPPAPTAPELCVDQPGYFQNHSGDKVDCAWFDTVGTYNYEKNCEHAEIGQACLLTCQEYNDCILPSDAPSYQPSPFPSPSSLPPTLTPTPAPPRSITIEATGDATIREASPNAVLGTSQWLAIDAATLPQDIGPGETDSGTFHVVLKFDLSGHNGHRPIESAVLRLKAGNSCASGGYLEKTISTQWDESSVTWATAPEGDGNEIGSLSSTTSGYWYEIDVASALDDAGLEALGLRLFPTTSEECLFVSRNDGGGDGPELHIEYND